MKTRNLIHHILLWGIVFAFPAKTYSQSNTKQEVKMETNQASTTSQRIFIDKFIVPEAAKPEFLERMNINRSLIKTLPGFIEDAVYERPGEEGNTIVVTVAAWESEDAIKKAKETVQAEYKRSGFNLQAMLERLHIVLEERGVYTKHAK